MDNLPGYIQPLVQHPLVQNIASSPLASNVAHLHAQYLEPSMEHVKQTYLEPSLAHLRMEYLDPYIVQPLAHMLSSMPDLVSILVLIFVLFISLKLLDYTRRAVIFWMWMTVRLVWWSSMFAIGLYMYNAGLEKVMRDVGFIFKFLVGLFEQVGHGLEESAARTGNGSGQNL